MRRPTLGTEEAEGTSGGWWTGEPSELPGNYIVTEDRHFEALRNSGYQPEPTTPEDFIRRFLP